MKTGTLGRPWVTLERPQPPAVADHYAYWIDPPPETSERCAYWLRQIEAGWLPPRRWRVEDCDGTAQRYGVYIWEWRNILAPAIWERFQALR